MSFGNDGYMDRMEDRCREVMQRVHALRGAIERHREDTEEHHGSLNQAEEHDFRLWSVLDRTA